MAESSLIKEVDIHLLELRYGHTRVQNDRASLRMQHSINSHDQIVPALAVASEDVNRFVLIDGYLRLKALVACGHDCINLQVMDGDEQGALLALLARNNDRQWEAIEEAAMLYELHSRFSCSFGEIGKKIGKDKSWVKRRVDLLPELSEEITQAVMSRKLSAWAASRVLAPLSRANAEDANQLTKKLIKDPLSTRIFPCIVGRYYAEKVSTGSFDLESFELSICSSMHGIGCNMLAMLVNADGGDYRGSIPCEKGHRYEFIEYRDKKLRTVLGPVAVKRAYYYDQDHRTGYCPKDRILDIEGTSYSSGVRRMMSRVGAYRSFGLGHEDLYELAAIRVSAKEVERISQIVGGQVEAFHTAEA